MVSVTYRRNIPIIIIWITFLLLTADYFLDIELGGISSFIKNGGIVVSAFTAIVGAISYVIRSLSRISNWRNETKLQLYFEVVWWTIFITILTVFFTKGLASEEYLWLNRSFYAPASSGIWAICVVLTVVVVYQKYRIRRLETGIFVAGFAFLMLGRSPVILALIPGSEPVVMKIVDLFETPITKILLILSSFGAFSLAFESLRGRIGGFD